MVYTTRNKSEQAYAFLEFLKLICRECGSILRIGNLLKGGL